MQTGLASHQLIGSNPACCLVRGAEQVALPNAMAISSIVKGRRAATIISKTFLTVLRCFSGTRWRIFHMLHSQKALSVSAQSNAP